MSDHETCTARLRDMSTEELGRFGEKLWSLIFEKTNLNYIPLHEASRSGAPMMRGQERVILPDYEVDSFSLPAVFADSKAKRHPVYYRHAHEWRHGIDRRNYEHYQKISGLKRKHCALVIFEAFQDEQDGLYSGALLGQTLDKLSVPFGQHGLAGNQMIYWPRFRFDEIGRLAPTEVADLFRGRPVPAVEQFKDPLWAMLGHDASIQGIFF